MNFVVAFILLINGGNDEDAYWMMRALTEKHEGKFAGLYQDGFPLYFDLMTVFNRLLEQRNPRLASHFEEIGFLHPMWL